MNSTIYYREPQDEKEYEHIQIEYSPKFYETVKELIDHINSLPIGQPENDRLIELILNHVKTVAHAKYEVYSVHLTNKFFKIGRQMVGKHPFSAHKKIKPLLKSGLKSMFFKS